MKINKRGSDGRNEQGLAGYARDRATHSSAGRERHSEVPQSQHHEGEAYDDGEHCIHGI